MSQMQPRGGREEKDEKHHEKEEKGRSDPLSAAAWGVIVIWAGIVFLADNVGLLNLRGGVPGAFVFQLQAWPLIFLGAGVILLLEAVVRMYRPEYRRADSGNIFLGLVFVAIGLGNMISWNFVWPLLLIGLGAFLLLRGFRWRG